VISRGVLNVHDGLAVTARLEASSQGLGLWWHNLLWHGDIFEERVLPALDCGEYEVTTEGRALFPASALGWLALDAWAITRVLPPAVTAIDVRAAMAPLLALQRFAMSASPDTDFGQTGSQEVHDGQIDSVTTA
jgi:hypothetical protein